MYHILYKTVRPATGEFYYGIHSTEDIYDGYQGSGKRIKRLLKKGENLITGIVSFYHTRDELYQAEANIVNEELLKDPKCLNIILGGYGVACDDISDRIKEGLNSRTPEQIQKHKENIKKKRNSHVYSNASNKRLETINNDPAKKEEWQERMRKSNKNTWSNKTKEEIDNINLKRKEKRDAKTTEELQAIGNSISQKLKGRIWIVNENNTSYFISNLEDEKLKNNGPWRRGKKWHSSKPL